MCTKLGYRNKHQARKAVRRMSNTVRVYECPECGYGIWHVTKDRYVKR